MMSRLSVVVPVLNEAAVIEDLLHSLSPLRRQGAEVIIVDGGSSDNTAGRARPLADHVLTAPRGRASQMNAGAAHASGDILVFLHADTRLSEAAAASMLDQMAGRKAAWGRFDVRIDGRHFLLPVIAALMNGRSRLTGIATGDQAIFVRRDAFVALGGYADIPLMEDIELCARLRQVSRPICVAEPVSTSGRRWEKHGVVRTILLMWRLRAAYFRGADPRELANRYGYAPRHD
jgi:rSAM/selenodomain-associated transferase 2